MNILTIMGSPKKNGKTVFALEKFESSMEAEGHSVERINAIDVKVTRQETCLTIKFPIYE